MIDRINHLSYFLSFIAVIMLSFSAKSASIYGEVTDQSGVPLPYANIIIKGTTQGTTTNEAGFYELQVQPGTYHLVFQYTGYKSVKRKITVDKGRVELNITLEKQVYAMDPVTVSDEDPAYRIIRNAIDRKSHFREEVQSYQCQVYAKANMQADTALSNIIVDTGDLPEGYLYLSESVSELYYQYPDKLKEKMISSRVSGNQQGLSFNFAFNEPVTFYQNYIDFEGSTKRPIISPIADNALFFYDYEWEGTFTKNQKRIHRIRVIPKRPSDPVFKGYINIVNESWRVQGVNLKIRQSNGLRQFDSFRMRQTYVPVNDSIWRLYNQNFRLKGSLIGLGLTMNALSHFSEYDLHPGLSDEFFDNELVKITKESTSRDSTYWEKARPVKLRPDEIEDFRKKDSIEQVRNSPAYIDSVDSVNNQPDLGDFLYSGYNYRKRLKNVEASASSLIPTFFRYNTVEGWAPQLDLTFRKDFDTLPALSIEPFIRYGIADKTWKGGIDIKRDPWQVKAGKTVRQFNGNNPISSSLNTAYTLFNGINHMKIYEATYAELGFSKEIGNGWFPAVNLEWSRRKPLQNNTDFTFVADDERNFTPNTPDHPFFENRQGFVAHEAFIIDAGLEFKPGLKYITIKGEKQNLGTEWPTFKLNYRKAIPDVAGSDAQFGLATIGVEGDINFHLAGRFHFEGTAGKFLDETRVPFMDYRHFSGQELTYYFLNGQGFQLLNFYEASTTKPFAEGHLTHHFNGFIWNKLPWIKEWQWEVVADGNILYRENSPLYWEWGVGLSNIFTLFGADLFTVSYYQGFNEGQFQSQGLRIGINNINPSNL